MKRRSFFTTVAAAFGAAKVAPAIAAPVKVIETPLMVPAGASGTYNPPEFTVEQNEVLRVLGLPQTVGVLFSGHRACGKSFICQYAEISYGKTLMVTPHPWVVKDFKKTAFPKTKVISANRDSIEGLLGLQFDRVIIDDAHLIEEEALLKIVWTARNFYGGAKFLLTAMPFGPGVNFIREMFPNEGWSTGGICYHVHAKPWSNPHMKDWYAHWKTLRPEDMPEVNGDWS